VENVFEDEFDKFTVLRGVCHDDYACSGVEDRGATRRECHALRLEVWSQVDASLSLDRKVSRTNEAVENGRCEGIRLRHWTLG
jgi:hypothetical protein